MPLSIPGPTGPTGPAGPTGPKGADGTIGASRGASMYYRQSGGGSYVSAGPTNDRNYVAGMVAAETLVNITATANNAYLIPHFFAANNRIVEVGYYVNTAGSALNGATIAAYTNTDDASLYPANQLETTELIPGNTVGFKYQAVNWTFAQDTLVWFAIATNANMTLKGVPLAAAWPILGFDATVSVAQPGIGYTAPTDAQASHSATFNQSRTPYTGSGAFAYPAVFMKHG